MKKIRKKNRRSERKLEAEESPGPSERRAEGEPNPYANPIHENPRLLIATVPFWLESSSPTHSSFPLPSLFIYLFFLFFFSFWVKEWSMYSNLDGSVALKP